MDNRTYSNTYAQGTHIDTHVYLAELVLGKKLPIGAEVHHADGDPRNNSLNNLVICPDRSYHQLLHSRMKARDVCGNADFRICGECKTWDDPYFMIWERVNSYKDTVRWFHRECRQERNRRKKSSYKARIGANHA